MTKTYKQILKQIDALKAEAEKVRRHEADGVISRIREAISAYGLTAADLGLERRKPGPKPGSRRGPGRPRKTSTGRKVAPKFRDSNGNTWAGRGKRPVWLREALAAGAKLEDFAVK
jgi:DNA-binding protein H-NS